MNTVLTDKNFQLEGFSSLYYLLIEADGVVDERETAMGRLMCEYERFDMDEFQILLERYKTMDKEEIFKKCVASLSGCKYATQVRCVAWMSNIANSDGFMSSEEWKLIFRIYKKELALKQEDILQVQRQLPKY